MCEWGDVGCEYEKICIKIYEGYIFLEFKKKSYENVKRVLYRGKERVKLNEYA